MAEPRSASLLATLNSEQQRAVTAEVAAANGAAAGPLLIIAGAGTGKTNTLAHRGAYLLARGVAPQRIALMTFSRRAAGEMLHRASLILDRHASTRGGDGSPRALARQLWSGTFHALGARLLRQYATALSMSPGFSILDRGDSAVLMDMLRAGISGT